MKNVLYCKTHCDRVDCITMQMVFPQAYTEQALKGCYNDIGHLRIENMPDLPRDRLYLPSMQVDAQRHVHSCPMFIRFKAN